MKRESKQEPQIYKIAAIVFALYWVLIVAFFFLAGEQLHLRQSRGNLELPAAEAGTIELTQGAVIEQHFSAKIQRLESVSLQWSAYYRTNTGTVTLALYDAQEVDPLLSQSYDVSSILEGGTLILTAPEPIETIYDKELILRVTADSLPGSAASPLMSHTAQQDGFSLWINGAEWDGMLCFSASGEDYIWTGLHYWQFAGGIGALLALFLLYVCRCWRRGRHSYTVNALIAVQKYRFLIRQLVSRDFRTKYKRSILGMFWSFLNPLLTMCVQYFVFSTIFKSDIPNYAAYLLIGIVFFNFFSEACGMAITSITGNAALITKVYLPKYIYPLTRIMSSVVNLGISLIPLLLVCAFTGVVFCRATVLAFYFLACLMVFTLGLGLLLSSAMVFFRDTQFLWSVFSLMWMYATPIFYPETILPENFRIILQINPLYYLLRNTRMCILEGLSPEPAIFVQCFLIALCMLAIGALVFQKSQDRFILYL